MPGDPYWDNVVFLSGFEGGTVVDESPLAQTVTLYGTTDKSSAQAKYGTQSLLMPGSGQGGASVPDHASMVLGTNPFTIECFAYLISDIPGTNNWKVLLAQVDSYTGADDSWAFYLRSVGTPGTYQLIWYANELPDYSGDSTGVTASGVAVTSAAWHHFALDFDGTTYRVYADGVMVGSETYTIPIGAAGVPLSLGTFISNTSSTDTVAYNMYQDEVRVTVGTARYATDTSFTPPTAAFDRFGENPLDTVMEEGVGLFGGCGLGDVWSLTLTDGIGTHQGHNPGWPKALTDMVQTVDHLRYAQGAVLSQGIGAHDALAGQIALLLAETFRTVEVATPGLKYQGLTVEAVGVTEALVAGWAMTLADTIASSAALSVARGVVVAESLGLLQGQVAAAVYHLTALERARLADSLGRFFGGDLTDGVGLSEALGLLRKTSAALTDGAGVNDAIAPRFLIQVTAADTVGISPAQALRMLFSPNVVEGVEISAGYVSPSGSVTTWAMNTSTGAVTEYRNYAFNSFARLGSRYVGASDNGLYELSGDSDDGTDIIAEMKSGFMQFAGAKHALLKRIYMAARGDGEWVLKVVTGEGQEYHYGVTTVSMHTAKVHLGKGLRARYFAFELISTGQDFDLESLEFVPIAAQRRV